MAITAIIMADIHITGIRIVLIIITRIETDTVKNTTGDITMITGGIIKVNDIDRIGISVSIHKWLICPISALC